MILHGGVGTIMQGLRINKPIIVVPRLKAYNEHVDDHQLEAAYALKSNKCLLICINVTYLEYMIKHVKGYGFHKYIEPNHRVEDIILEYIEETMQEEKLKKVKKLRKASMKQKMNALMDYEPQIYTGNKVALTSDLSQK